MEVETLCPLCEVGASDLVPQFLKNFLLLLYKYRKIILCIWPIRGAAGSRGVAPRELLYHQVPCSTTHLVPEAGFERSASQADAVPTELPGRKISPLSTTVFILFSCLNVYSGIFEAIIAFLRTCLTSSLDSNTEPHTGFCCDSHRILCNTHVLNITAVISWWACLLSCFALTSKRLSQRQGMCWALELVCNSLCPCGDVQ